LQQEENRKARAEIEAQRKKNEEAEMKAAAAGLVKR